MRDQGAEAAAVAALAAGLERLHKADSSVTYYENSGVLAFWGDVEARDKRARQEKTYFHGRFSEDSKR